MFVRGNYYIEIQLKMKYIYFLLFIINNFKLCRAVAENGKLQIINGSELKKYERKDCEIFYLRRTFEDYF